jgi:hypothetical protein
MGRDGVGWGRDVDWLEVVCGLIGSGMWIVATDRTVRWLAVRSVVAVPLGGSVGDTVIRLSQPAAVCISSSKNELQHGDSNDRFSNLRLVKAPMLCVLRQCM